MKENKRILFLSLIYNIIIFLLIILQKNIIKYIFNQIFDVNLIVKQISNNNINELLGKKALYTFIIMLLFIVAEIIFILLMNKYFKDKFKALKYRLLYYMYKIYSIIIQVFIVFITVFILYYILFLCKIYSELTEHEINFIRDSIVQLKEMSRNIENIKNIDINLVFKFINLLKEFLGYSNLNLIYTTLNNIFYQFNYTIKIFFYTNYSILMLISLLASFNFIKVKSYSK